MNRLSAEPENVWPHRWAVALACATFPLIWIGALVTTYDAGMAVEDWPNTYGYNLFLYPLRTWFYGPWGLFIEHGHRLFGTLVGMLSIGFLVSTWRCKSRPILRWLGLVALFGAIGQGVLGGMRVHFDQVQLAKIHGCVGPAYFAFTVALAAVTSRLWQHGVVQNCATLPKIERLAIMTTLLAYCQLVLGSQLRHLSATAYPGNFRLALYFHLAVAATLLVHIVLLSVEVYRSQRTESSLLRPAGTLVVLIAMQLTLGVATWVLKYGWPAWLGNYQWAAGYTVLDGSLLQAMVTTAHVAIGSAILATSLLISVRSVRFAWRRSHASVRPGAWLMEAAQ